MLEARDEHLKKKQRQQAMFRKCVPAMSSFCVALILGFGFWKHINKMPEIESVPPIVEATTANIETINPTTHSEIIKPPTVPPTETYIEPTTPTETEPASASETVSIPPTEQQTEVTGSEAIIAPKWDDRSLPTRFLELKLDGITYSTRNHSIDDGHISNILGTVTMEGHDVYEDKIHSTIAEVFSIRGISSNCAVAVKFNGYDSYYTYTNRDYSPTTLGELVDALDLNNTISFGTLSLEDDRTFVTDYDRSIISELLNKYRDCATLFDYDGHRKLFSVSTSVDMLGISNKSFAVTEDGYIKTNIMEQGYAFYIGEDRSREIADRLGIDNIERDTTPQIFNPEEEVFYEE